MVKCQTTWIPEFTRVIWCFKSQMKTQVEHQSLKPWIQKGSILGKLQILLNTIDRTLNITDVVHTWMPALRTLTGHISCNNSLGTLINRTKCVHLLHVSCVWCKEVAEGKTVHDRMIQLSATSLCGAGWNSEFISKTCLPDFVIHNFIYVGRALFLHGPRRR